MWRNHVLQTDDADTQWGKMMKRLGVDVTYALSPQAKGKVERPYRWLQDRIVRTCALEKISKLDQVSQVLQEEVKRYNQHQVHSTTKEIPAVRFGRALSERNSLFRSFSLPQPYTSADDIFCLHETRITNPYGRISLSNHQIRVPDVPLRQQADVHLVPDPLRDLMHIRIWYRGELVQEQDLPLDGFRVQFSAAPNSISLRE